jgi:DNA recombination protein RmuC
MEIVFLIVGLAIGALTAWLAARARTARLETELEHERRSLSEGESSRLQLEGTLKALSGELQKDARDDLESRQRAVERMITPLKESLEKVTSGMQDLERARSSGQAAVSTQIRDLAEAQARLHAETATLAGAMRSTGTRGRWGEIQLRRIVELAGMVSYCDFDEQRALPGDGPVLRPDLVVRLPGGRNVVIDAKAPFDAYLQSSGAATEEERRTHLATHSKALRSHVSQLAAKAYWERFEPTPGFVVLYMPNEPLLHAALEHDPMLIEDAAKQGVLLTSPASLIALLRAVAEGWRQETVADNAREVARVGQQLYDRIAAFAEHLVSMRKGLDGAVKAYNGAVGSLERSVLPAARRFPDLGVPASRPIAALDPVQATTRAAQAPELVARIPGIVGHDAGLDRNDEAREATGVSDAA